MMGGGDVLEPRLAVRVVRHTDRCVCDRLEQSYLPWLARYRYGAPPPGARCMVHSCIVMCLWICCRTIDVIALPSGMQSSLRLGSRICWNSHDGARCVGDAICGGSLGE